ncbi:hypothetical protein [Devosia sp. CN2-171]|uniref:hypothetical protein n=1 Tax=Devosia sp. CN2-171 TaxID=3400909 RepID=UPI003BF7E129
MSKKKKVPKPVAPTGVPEVDLLAAIQPTIQDYINAVSAYVRTQSTLAAGPKKAGQIRLSNGLSRALANELVAKLPALKDRLVTQEKKVAGGLRTVNADVSESHELDGLRLAVELKPINLAVGRAIWNRFGDIRTFAVNIHLKFPFAVVGGVLVIPTYEITGTKAAKEAEIEEIQEEEDVDTEQALEIVELEEALPVAIAAVAAAPTSGVKRPTTHLIERAIDRLVRAGGRKSEAESTHLLEGIAVLVYDPDTATIHPTLPPAGSRLRWDEFVDDIATSRRARFED